MLPLILGGTLLYSMTPEIDRTTAKCKYVAPNDVECGILKILSSAPSRAEAGVAGRDELWN